VVEKDLAKRKGLTRHDLGEFLLHNLGSPVQYLAAHEIDAERCSLFLCCCRGSVLQTSSSCMRLVASDSDVEQADDRLAPAEQW